MSWEGKCCLQPSRLSHERTCWKVMVMHNVHPNWIGLPHVAVIKTPYDSHVLLLAVCCPLLLLLLLLLSASGQAAGCGGAACCAASQDQRGQEGRKGSSSQDSSGGGSASWSRQGQGSHCKVGVVAAGRCCDARADAVPCMLRVTHATSVLLSVHR